MPEDSAPVAETQVETKFDGVDVEDAPRVSVLAATKAELELMQPGLELLKSRRIRYETRLMNCLGEAEAVSSYTRNAKLRGIRVIIAAASMSAPLPGFVASQTDLPVIGVPCVGPQSVGGGLDALLAVAQMPAGTPVACMAINGAENAAELTARILNS